MWVHFADSAGGRGQFAALFAEGCRASPLSYHYAKVPGILRGFKGLWEALRVEHAGRGGEPVNLHLTSSGPHDMLKAAYRAEGTDKHLLSYAQRNDEKTIYGPVWDGLDRRARVIIDSGAFTAWSSGKPIKPQDYGKWSLEFSARWRGRLASLRFMNLDVIGDQVASWRNQETLERMGLDPIPIITYRAPIEHLSHALERYEYVAFGGLVSTSKAQQQRWLDHLFREVMRYRAETGKLRRVHLLGVATRWASLRYPLYSCDSSTWTQSLRFGHGRAAGFRQKVPRYRDGPAQHAAAMHALRHEIRRSKELETEATNLWRNRGVTWDG